MAYNYYANTVKKYSDTGKQLGDYNLVQGEGGLEYQMPTDYANPIQQYPQITEGAVGGGTESSSPDFGNFESAVQGVAIGQKYQAPKGTFETDKLAGLKSSAEGYASGGPIAAMVAGTVAQFGQAQNIRDAINNVSTDVKGYSTVGGKPTYYGSNIYAASKTAKQMDKAANPNVTWESFVSPSSNIVQAVNVGAARDKQRKLRRRIRREQEGYNTARQDYSQSMIARQEYENRLGNNRLQNLYGNY